MCVHVYPQLMPQNYWVTNVSRWTKSGSLSISLSAKDYSFWHVPQPNLRCQPFSTIGTPVQRELHNKSNYLKVLIKMQAVRLSFFNLKSILLLTSPYNIIFFSLFWCLHLTNGCVLLSSLIMFWPKCVFRLFELCL